MKSFYCYCVTMLTFVGITCSIYLRHSIDPQHNVMVKMRRNNDNRQFTHAIFIHESQRVPDLTAT